MPQMDPKVAAFLKANPDRTPSEAIQVLYGKRASDVALKPAPRSLWDLFGVYGQIGQRVRDAK